MDKQHLIEAYEEGKGMAEAAATWCFDGNSDREERARVLKMLDDGDPEAYDYLPREPNLSGEYADDPTPLSLARDITGEDDPDPDLIDALADEFERGVDENFQAACERELRSFVS